MQTRACDFCGTDIEPGTGTMFVFVDGQVDHYCSSKCEKNADLGRVPRDVEWTEEGQRLRQRRQRTVGSQDAVEEVAAEAPEDTDELAADVDTVPEESDAQAVAAATSGAGAEGETAARTEDDRVDAVADDNAEARSADDEELEEVLGRRAGGDDPDVEEDIQHEDSSVERRDPDPENAAATTQDTARETDDTDTEFDAEDVDRTGEETVSEEEADETVVEGETDEETDENAEDEQ
jgi:large subunit ribosomal protein L24e